LGTLNCDTAFVTEEVLEKRQTRIIFNRLRKNLQSTSNITNKFYSHTFQKRKMGGDVEAAKEVVVVDAPPWHAMTKAEVFAKLDLPDDIRKKGLTTEQAKARLIKYGENKLSEKAKVTLLEKIWHQVNNVLVLILVIVAAVSLVRAITDDPVTNSIQVGIIVGVIAYVYKFIVDKWLELRILI
jgi:magnesium-transporting ATPase (P-type)